ncbi:MAG: hypothetical protein ACJATT_005864, partial [Myxococcota bacterium]
TPEYGPHSLRRECREGNSGNALKQNRPVSESPDVQNE